MMKSKMFSTNIQSLIDNPRNYTHQNMTACENFHLVKRVMSVRPSLRNEKPTVYNHLNNSRTNLKRRQVST